MTKVGITGHQRIPAVALDYVRAAVRAELARTPAPLIGYSSLAAGADQLFAHAVVEAGGQLIAVLPCAEYESAFDPADLPGYRALLAQAAQTVVRADPQPSQEAFMAAGELIVQQCDVLIAVWDGQPAVGHGGTGDVVEVARSLGKPVVIVWPAGVKR
jgi:hypothetical protein